MSMSENLKKDAYGSTLTRTVTYSFDRSPAGRHAGKFAVRGRRGMAVAQVGSTPTRGRQPWAVTVVEREREVDADVKTEWAEAGITGAAIIVTATVEVPGHASPTPGDVAQAFTLAREKLAVHYGIAPEEIVILD